MFFGSWSKKKKKLGFSQLLGGGGGGPEVVKIHNFFFFSNESFPYESFELHKILFEHHEEVVDSFK